MNDSTHIEMLIAQRERIRNQFAALSDFRRGSLNKTYRKCDKSYYSCADPKHPGHSLSWILMRTVNVKTVSRGIPPVALERPRRQMQEYLRFRVLVNEMVEINEQLCDARIKADRTAKKGALEKTYRHKSPPSSS